MIAMAAAFGRITEFGAKAVSAQLTRNAVPVDVEPAR